jgi:hypothetical protein
MSSIAIDPLARFRLFRMRDETPNTEEPLVDNVDHLDIPGIRCPLCKWRPKRNDKWVCWDCEYPEYFYAGCGTAWNTFETLGTCPTCLHKWQWTSCFGCFMWSKHEDWYEDRDGK